MTDTVFRSKVTQTEVVPEAQKVVKRTDKFEEQKLSNEIPYTDYEKFNHHPYLVDHFKLGDTWRDKIGGFEKEITNIEEYFRERINHGQMQNTTEAVKDTIKKIYKLCKIDKNERITMQIEKLSAYIEFLKKTDDIKLKHYKYAN